MEPKISKDFSPEQIEAAGKNFCPAGAGKVGHGDEGNNSHDQVDPALVHIRQPEVERVVEYEQLKNERPAEDAFNHEREYAPKCLKQHYVAGQFRNPLEKGQANHWFAGPVKPKWFY